MSPKDLLHKTLMIYSYIIIFVSCLNSLTLPGLWSNPGVFKAANKRNQLSTAALLHCCLLIQPLVFD